MYKTPAPKEFNFNDIKGSVPLKWGNMYIRLDMHTEDYKEDIILLSNQVIQGYEIPSYLQENVNHPEIDEHEENRNKERENRRLQRELAIQRKKLLYQLMEREKRIKEKIKEEEKELRKELTDALRKKLQDDLDKRKKELDDIKKELDAELLKLANEKRQNDLKKQKRLERKQKAIEDKDRTGIRIKLEGLAGGFRSKLLIKVVYGLFLEDEVLLDDLGDIMVYETQYYNDDGNKSTNKEGKKVKVGFELEEKEFVRNMKTLISLNEPRGKKVYFGFQVVGTKPKENVAADEVKDINEEDPLKDLPLPEKEELILMGWEFLLLDIGSRDKGKKKTIKMNKPPLIKPDSNIPPSKAKKKAAGSKDKDGMELTFIFYTFQYNMDSLNYFADQRVKKKKVNKDTFEKAKKRVYDKYFRDAFIKNIEPQYTDILFTKGSGIDVYIDACRFLPDNVTVTKVR